jgi:hypothetical protein
LFVCEINLNVLPGFVKKTIQGSCRGGNNPATMEVCLTSTGGFATVSPKHNPASSARTGAQNPKIQKHNLQQYGDKIRRIP